MPSPWKRLCHMQMDMCVHCQVSARTPWRTAQVMQTMHRVLGSEGHLVP